MEKTDDLINMFRSMNETEKNEYYNLMKSTSSPVIIECSRCKELEKQNAELVEYINNTKNYITCKWMYEKEEV